MSQPTQRSNLLELTVLFLKLGTIGFGGPAAHIALMEDEVVRKKRWLSREQFIDLVGATSLIPGPNSTELALHIGRQRAGWVGLLVAGLAFIVPAALIVSSAAWVYRENGRLPAVAGLLYGIKPVMIAIVLRALWGLKDLAFRTRTTTSVAAGSVIVALAWPLHEVQMIAAAGLVSALAHLAFHKSSPLAAAVLFVPGGPLFQAATVGPASAAPLTTLFLVFVKAGALLFGSGYVLLAFLRTDVVFANGWLSEAELLDAIAVGQMTPGPVFTTATFIGYLVAGGWGAIVATVGIFLPAFVFVAASAPFLPHLRASPLFGAVLDGVNAVSIALMAAVTWQLAHAAVVDVWTFVLAVVALGLLVARVSPTWVITSGALAGWALARVSP